MKIRGQGGLLWRLLPLVRVVYWIGGKSWIQFYSWMLDRQERFNSAESLLKKSSVPGRDKGLYDVGRGEYHAEYLIRHGLRPEHRFLDFGCGYGRTAVPLLRYLNPGNYVGMDISRERIRMARELIAATHLVDAAPTFITNEHNELKEVVDGKFNFVWAQSVFTHMPKADVVEVFKSFVEVMEPRAVFVFNFTEGEKDGIVHNAKDFDYTLEFFLRLAAQSNFDAEVLNDWKDDLSPEERDPRGVMLKLTLRAQ